MLMENGFCTNAPVLGGLIPRQDRIAQKLRKSLSAWYRAMINSFCKRLWAIAMRTPGALMRAPFPQ